VQPAKERNAGRKEEKKRKKRRIYDKGAFISPVAVRLNSAAYMRYDAEANLWWCQRKKGSTSSLPHSAPLSARPQVRCAYARCYFRGYSAPRAAAPARQPP